MNIATFKFAREKNICTVVDSPDTLLCAPSSALPYIFDSMAGTRGLRKRAEVNYHEKQSNMVPAWLNKMNLDQTPPEPKRKKQAVKPAELKDSPTTNKENESGSQRQPVMVASPAREAKKAGKPKKVKRTVVASRGRDQGMTVAAYGTCG